MNEAKKGSSLATAAVVMSLCLVAAACSSGSSDAAPESTVDQSGAVDGTTDGGDGADENGQGAVDDSAPSVLGFEGPLTVVVANTPGAVTTSGPQRVMTALLGQGANQYLGGAEQPVTVQFRAVADGTLAEAEGSWLTTNASTLGLYVTYSEFSIPGLWEVIIFADGQELGATLIEVVESSPIPTTGDPAPQSPSATATTAAEIATISTDFEPDPDFYDLSIAEAVTNGRPTLIAFVTPAFCQTALCGPTLETVKAAAASRPGIDAVHVEPFDLELAPSGILQPIPLMEEWGLQTEPWVFVVDSDGLVSASFEGIIGLEELEDALDRL